MGHHLDRRRVQTFQLDLSLNPPIVGVRWTSLQGRQCHHQQHLLDHSQRYQLEHRWHLQIDNNNNLKQFDTQIANITNAVNINANGNQLAVTFPNLIWAANMTFRNVSSIKIPSLATVNGSMGFYGNY